MDEKELLAKTQMALALTNPWKDEWFFMICKHCGEAHSYSIIMNSQQKKLHQENCIWLIALLATGDYDETH